MVVFTVPAGSPEQNAKYVSLATNPYEMKDRLLLLFLLFLMAFTARASYEVTPRCEQAWVMVMNLDFDGARRLMAEEQLLNPQNYYALYLEQTADAYQLYINGTDEDYKRFIDAWEARREIMDDHDEESPYYLACDAEMQIQAGLFNILAGEEFSGIRKMYSAYRKVYRNLDEFPDFPMSRKLDGFFNVALGNLPPFIRSAVSLFGVKGNLNKGFEILEETCAAQSQVPGINAETALFMIFAGKINKTPERLYEFVNSLDTSIANTYVHQYFRANIDYRTGHNEQALELLLIMDNDRNQDTRLISDYLLGKVLMRKLDTTAAVHLNRYLKYHLKEEYYKEIRYQLALLSLLEGDEQAYLRQAAMVREKGKELQERDREALYDASVDYPPSPVLVRAELLLSGGYLPQAIGELAQVDTNAMTCNGHRLWYRLLMAQALEQQHQQEQAMVLYRQIILTGAEEEYSFASEAALRLGWLYDDQGRHDKARPYYDLSLKLYESEYDEFIEDKAKKAAAED